MIKHKKEIEFIECNELSIEHHEEGVSWCKYSVIFSINAEGIRGSNVYGNGLSLERGADDVYVGNGITSETDWSEPGVAKLKSKTGCFYFTIIDDLLFITSNI